jgi:Mor family transcriptional regulator
MQIYHEKTGLINISMSSEFLERNLEIYQKFLLGEPVTILSKNYKLSETRIRQICRLLELLVKQKKIKL